MHVRHIEDTDINKIHTLGMYSNKLKWKVPKETTRKIQTKRTKSDHFLPSEIRSFPQKSNMPALLYVVKIQTEKWEMKGIPATVSHCCTDNFF